jgi:aminoglycoside phosphotransferase (APT) family kinase protein
LNAAPGAEALRERLQRGAAAWHPRAARVAALRRFSGGASQETWGFELRAADETLLDALVLRRAAPAARRTDGHPSLADEARLITLAGAAGVPVPALVAELEPTLGLGPGYLMRHVPGQTLGRRIVDAPELAEARRRLARQCGQALARIHALDPAGLPAGLRRAPAAAERAHYAAQHRARGWAKPVFELALRWLGDHLPPEPARLRLVHGDFRNGNLIVDAHGLRAVLDWELAHLGDPMEDLGWLCVPSWRFGRLDLPVGGFGTRDELFAGYAEAGGEVEPARVRFWQLLGTLKWGLMCESMAQAHLSGDEPSVERAAIGRRASETEIDLLDQLAGEAAR